MIVAGGKVRFFSSKDLKEWKFESINENIQTECPDMFELPIDGDKAKTKWVLNKGGRGIILGSFDGKKFIPEFPGFALNYGPDFYASQTFSDVPDGRCIMSTWMYHWGIVGWPGRWGGAMTIPVQLKLRTTPEGVRLYQTPVKELESLRYDKYKVENISVSGNRSLPIKTQQLEIVCRFKPGSAKRFGINVLIGRDGEKTVVGYDAPVVVLT